MINIYFINERIVLKKNSSLIEAITQKKFTHRCYSIMLNNNFIPRCEYANTLLNDGDIIEIITPMQGG
jgi:sulfur carrier protein